MFTGTADLYDLFYASKDYRTEAAHIKEIVHARAPYARTLLDVACGTGRHLERLEEWFEVEGLDLDPKLLAVAERRLPAVRLHVGDMTSFALGRTFDVVTCLFSSIGYARTPEAMGAAIATMARHVAPAGLLIVEPWLSPEDFDPHHLGRLIVVEAPDLNAVRTNGSSVVGRTSVMSFHYLVARPGTVEHLTESHVLGLFTPSEYQGAFRAAGLDVEHDPDGLIGRGLYVGSRTAGAG
jgi:SAM-dependent methyltransferase